MMGYRVAFLFFFSPLPSLFFSFWIQSTRPRQSSQDTRNAPSAINERPPFRFPPFPLPPFLPPKASGFERADCHRALSFCTQTKSQCVTPFPATIFAGESSGPGESKKLGPVGRYQTSRSHSFSLPFSFFSPSFLCEHQQNVLVIGGHAVFPSFFLSFPFTERVWGKWVL